MPAVRGEVAAAAVGDKLFALGGGVAGKAVPRNEEYDPLTDRWRPRAPLPQARDHLGVAVLNGKIYAFGGFTSSVHQGAGDVVFEYDPSGDSWQTLTPMRAPRASVAVAALDARLHVVGGRGLDGVTVATHDVYDPTTAKWSTAAPLPRPRDHMALVAAEEKSTPLADAWLARPTALASMTSMIPRRTDGRRRRRCRRRAAASLRCSTRT
jgi:hypothetical protein